VLFNSYEFLLVFLPLVVVVYYVLPRPVRAAWLTLASYFFYGWWRVECIGLMLLLTVVNYVGGRMIHRSRQGWARGAWLAASLALSLGVLSFFKYFDFLIQTWNDLSGWAGAVSPLRPLGVLLPVGISFYTFQSVSYPIDIYRGISRPTRRLIDFACYVSLFPQLIAGPIVRYNEIAEQLEERRHTADKVARGLAFFIVGLAKKALLADALAPAAELAFDKGAPGAAVAWVGLLAYSFQIYFDFSGYSDMAIGLGLLLGFEFPRNFNSPYQATSIRDFWRRWHMSLSRWLRDYLYFSIGGSRRGRVRTYVNVMATMLLGGLWHGANWTFVLWGGYHGVLICTERALGQRNPLSRLPLWLKRGGTFLLVLFGWVLFRSASLVKGGALLGGLFGARGLGELPRVMRSTQFLGALAIAAVVAFGCRNLFQWRWRITERTAAWALPLFLVSLYAALVSGYSPFLYFQF